MYFSRKVQQFAKTSRYISTRLHCVTSYIMAFLSPTSERTSSQFINYFCSLCCFQAAI